MQEPRGGGFSIPAAFPAITWLSWSSFNAFVAYAETISKGGVGSPTPARRTLGDFIVQIGRNIRGLIRASATQ